MSKPTKKIHETQDIVLGTDRYLDSPSFGRKVLDQIYMWRSPGCVQASDNLTGAVKPGTLVHVVRGKIRDGAQYYFVKCQVEHEGKLYPQKGWVRAPLLERLGLEEEGIVHVAGIFPIQ